MRYDVAYIATVCKAPVAIWERDACSGGGYGAGMLSKWLSDNLSAARVSQSDLARRLTERLGRSVDRAAVNKMTTGARKISADELIAITDILGVNRPDESPARPLIASFDPDAPDDDPAPADAEMAEAARRALRKDLGPGEVIERDARGGAGVGSHSTAVTVDGQIVDGVSATWRFPQSFLHSELRARESDVDMIPVDGDSMIPTLLPGDRVMIQRSARAPSPDGIFAISDGIGISVKRLQIVRGSDPLQVRILSDNPMHIAETIAASDLNVIGRVIMKVTRL